MLIGFIFREEQKNWAEVESFQLRQKQTKPTIEQKSCCQPEIDPNQSQELNKVQKQEISAKKKVKIDIVQKQKTKKQSRFIRKFKMKMCASLTDFTRFYWLLQNRKWPIREAGVTKKMKHKEFKYMLFESFRERGN